MTPKLLLTLRRTAIISVIVALLWLLAGVVAQDPRARSTATLLMAALAWYWWRLQLRHLLRVKKFGPVIPGKLYRSGQISHCHVKRTLSRYGIQTIVDLTGPEDRDRHQTAEQAAIKSLSLKGLKFPMSGDGTGSLDSVADAVTAIHHALANQRTVLVHCAAGVQRTGQVLSTYLLLVAEVNPDIVFQFMQRFGWCPAESPEWPQQMNRRMASIAAILQQRGVIDHIPARLPQLPLTEPSEKAPWWVPHQKVLASGLEIEI